MIISKTTFLSASVSLMFLICCANKDTAEKASQDNTLKNDGNGLPASNAMLNEKDQNSSNKQQKPLISEVELPQQDVELPQLSFDKSKLSNIITLDKMIMVHAQITNTYQHVYEGLQELEEKSEVSMSGTPEDIIKDVMTMVNGMKDFEKYTLPIVNKSITNFKEKYTSDNEFTSKYRDTYIAAEEQISGPLVSKGKEDFIIQDDVLRTKVMTEFRNGYLSALYTKLRDMEEAIETMEEIRSNMVGSVTSAVNTDLMLADYKQGKDLVDVLNGSINKLSLIKEIDRDNEEIADMMVRVKEKKKSRQEEVRKALESYRFPERYSGGNAVSDPATLEKRMKSYLEKEGYDVSAIVVASEWIAIHNVLGVLLYYQIDFYVASPREGNPKGVLEILYVTGKTSGADRSSFGTYSVGGIAQMLESNL